MLRFFIVSLFFMLKYRKTDINAHFKLIWDDILLVPKKDKKYQYMV